MNIFAPPELSECLESLSSPYDISLSSICIQTRKLTWKVVSLRQAISLSPLKMGNVPKPKDIIDYKNSMFTIPSDLSSYQLSFSTRGSEAYSVNLVEPAFGLNRAFWLVSAWYGDGVGDIWLG
jgi:hypothetical protein